MVCRSYQTRDEDESILNCFHKCIQKFNKENCAQATTAVGASSKMGNRTVKERGKFIMFVNRNEYEKLRDHAKLVDELEKECQRLADVISAKVVDCKVGVWCKDCKFLGKDRAVVGMGGLPYSLFIKECAGEVQYCKKHLYKICPEFEGR